MPHAQHQHDVLVVGAGFAGMYMLHRLREMGFSVRVFDTASDVGGTWYWNRYPGARCDVESVEYCYEFSDELVQNWNWNERYAAQPEILDYARHVADRFNLRSDIEFETRIVSADYDEEGLCWKLVTDAGIEHQARFCIFATGCLSVPIQPEIEGLASFAGQVIHTGQWPHEPVDLNGLRVGVMGTGSSGIQAIPLLARQAEHLTVFQRSASYTIPAHNGPLEESLQEGIKANYREFRQRSRDSGYIFGSRLPTNMGFATNLTAQEQEFLLEQHWSMGGLFFLRAFGDVQTDVASNEIAQEFVRSKIRSLVNDPETAELLCPDGIIGCKRLCADTGYYETYNRENVSLVDIKADPIVKMTPQGVQTECGSFDLDVLVLATGFDAMTGALERVDIRGCEQVLLRDNWQEGPAALLGLQVKGFPNLFTITGPGSPSVLSNMIQSIEQHVEWIADLLLWMRRNDYQRVEAQFLAQQSWMNYVAEMAETTLYPRCNSWYRGANIEGKPQVFSPCVGYMEYVEHCNEVAANGYPGFDFKAGS